MAGKPGRSGGRTSGTRKGNGAGLHGPAKGAGNGNPPAPLFAEGSPGYAGSGGGPNGGHGSRPTYKSLAKQDRIDALKELQWTAAHEAESETVRHWAREALLDREEGKATQRTELTGANGGPVMIVTGVPRDDED